MTWLRLLSLSEKVSRNGAALLVNEVTLIGKTNESYAKAPLFELVD